MSAMRAIELPELPVADLPVADLPDGPAAAQPQPTAASRAAALWTAPTPEAETLTVPVTSPASPAKPAKPAPARPARRQPPRAPVADPPLRLTRRGKIVVAVASALLAAGLSLVIATGAQAVSHGGSDAGQQGVAKITVRPGQSLWSVAESADPNADPRSVIQQITELNGLTADTVMPGQSLWVPRG